MPNEELTLILKLRDEATAQMKKAQAGFGSSVKKMAKIAAAAAAVIGAAVGATGFKLFKLASDAEEVTNVLHLAFGSMSNDVEAWAAKFSEATGTSRFEAREMVGDLGLIIKGLGFGSQATFDMSTRMTELARDMASAKNVRFEDALTKIRAGLLGEAEPLRVMGVALTAARVKEEAYARGIAARGAELTEANKVEARMQIILADSIAMHGDAANTLDSSANQWVEIQAVIKDAATELGQRFMPVFVQVLGYMRQGVDVAIDLVTSSNRWTEALGNVWTVVKPLVNILGAGLGFVLKKVVIPLIKGMVDNFNTLIGNLQTGYNWLARLVPGMEEVAVATEKASDAGYTFSDYLNEVGGELPMVSTALAGGAPGKSLAPSADVAAVSLSELSLVTNIQYGAYQKLWEIGAPVTDILVSHSREFGNLAGVVPGVTSSFKVLNDEATGLFSTFKGGFKDMIRGVTGGKGVSGMLTGIGKGITQGIGNIISGGLASLTDIAMNGLVTLGKKLWGGIKTLFGGPSDHELAGREVASGFRQGVIDGLSPSQMLEARRAAETGVGSVTGAALHIAIRDAKLAGSATIEEAERAATAMVEMLHTAESEGPAAVERAMAEIQLLLDSSKSATDEVTASIVEDADEIADRFAHMTSEEISELRSALRSLKPVAVDTFRGIRSSSLGAGVALQQFLVNILAVSRALSAIPRNVTTTITTRHVTENVPGRQHGGPVSGGSPYVVGEAGPEIFVPSSSGSVLPNSMAEDIGAAVVKALHRVPLVVPQDPVTDTLYRNGPRRAALKGYE